MSVARATADAKEDPGIKGDARKGRFSMATGKRKSHDLGTPVGRRAGNTLRQRRPRRQALSASRGNEADRDRKKPAAMRLRYSMVIAWSDEDQVYIVRLPEFDNAKTHGSTYESAAKQGRTLIESFLIWHKQDGEPLPEPQVFVDSSDQERDVSLAGTH